MIAAMEHASAREKPVVQLDHLSPSSVKEYLTCPLRFLFSRVLRIEKAVSPSLHVGKAVHAAIEAANRHQFRGEASCPDRILARYHSAFEEMAGQQAVDWQDPAQQAQAREAGERVVHAFLESETFRQQARPMGVEVQLSCGIAGTETRLLGYVDRVNPDGTPVDYKTVATTPDSALEAWQHQLQLTAYTELIEDATGRPCPGMELVFLVKTKTPKVIQVKIPAPTRLQRQRFWTLVQVVLDGVRGQRFHPQPGMQCGWCPYREECAGWGGNAQTGGAQ